MPCRVFLFLLLCALSLPERLVAQDTPAERRAAIEMMYPAMVKALESGRFGQARNICDQATVWEPDNPVHPYNLACIEARAGSARRGPAFEALARAAELGFSDLKTLTEDPDLASLRSDPQFAAIRSQVAKNSTQPGKGIEITAAEKEKLAHSPTAPPLVQPGLAQPIDLAALVDVASPVPAAFATGIPVGLYFMTRPWSYAGSVEKLVWYFAADGTVYQSPEYGFSPADLAAHPGPKGTCRLEGETLAVAWSDRRKSSDRIQRSKDGFTWDRGTFVPVRPFPAGTILSGAYEGGEALSLKPNRAPLARTLELRDDGTFYWRGVSFLTRSRRVGRVEAASNGYDTVGRWRANGYSLVLVDSEGQIFRRIAFPWHSSPDSPAGIVFAGTLYSRK